MGRGSNPDPKDSLRALEPPNIKLVFGLEVDFIAELKKDVFIQTGCESVGHALLERLQQLQLRCISSKNQGHKLVLEGADVEDPTMPYQLNDGERQMLNLVCPPYYLDASYGWEADMHRIFCCSPYKSNPLLASDLQMNWELDPSTSLTIYIEDRTHPEEGFPFHTARNLAMILLVFGPKIDSMVKSKVAQEVSRETGETWAGPQPIPDKYGSLSDKAGGQTPRELASYVLHNCSTMESLCEIMPELLSTLKYEFCESFKVDFSPLLALPRKGTESASQSRENSPDFPNQEYYSAQIRADRGPGIVFMHQPGTLDAAHIIHWIRFLDSLVEFANHIGLESLVLFLGLEENGYAYFRTNSNSLSEEEEEEEKDDSDTDSTETEYDETDTDTEFWEEPTSKGKKNLRDAGSSQTESETEFEDGPMSQAEKNLRTWDNVRWHPTLCEHKREDPPNHAIEATFQHLYPIRALIAGMDMVRTGPEHDTTKFWVEGLKVKYDSNVESDSASDLLAIKSEPEDEDEADEEIEGLEAMEGLSMTQEPDSDYDMSDPAWVPGTSSYSLSDDEVLDRKKRRCD